MHTWIATGNMLQLHRYGSRDVLIVEIMSYAEHRVRQTRQLEADQHISELQHDACFSVDGRLTKEVMSTLLESISGAVELIQTNSSSSNAVAWAQDIKGSPQKDIRYVLRCVFLLL